LTTWEYRVDTSGTEPSEIEEKCDPAGKDGWELVSAVVVEATPDEWRTRLIFKRPADN
jgi:hypothetical protein